MHMRRKRVPMLECNALDYCNIIFLFVSSYLNLF